MNTSTKLVSLDNERASNSQNSESAVNFFFMQQFRHKSYTDTKIPGFR